MATSLVTYELQDGIATITMNDGGKNLLSPDMLSEINKAFDQAEKDGAVVLLTGYDNILSAGFDLKVMRSGKKAMSMLNTGFALATRMLSFPTPIVIACNGHAVAMGVFVLLSGDYRLGASGPFKIVANEVAIGMTMPSTAIEVCRQRLKPAHFVRAVEQAEVYNPDTAVEAGFLDRVVAPEDLHQEALTVAQRLSKLDLDAHRRSKLRARRQLIQKMKRANFYDRFDIIRQGIRASRKRKK